MCHLGKAGECVGGWQGRFFSGWHKGMRVSGHDGSYFFVLLVIDEYVDDRN